MKADTKDTIRLAIAEFIQRLWPQYCWAKLVIWAFGYDEFWNIIRPEHFSQDCDMKSLWCMTCEDYREQLPDGTGK